MEKTVGMRHEIRYDHIGCRRRYIHIFLFVANDRMIAVPP